MTNKIFIAQHEMGLISNFVYFIGDPATRQMALVDPGWEADRVWKFSEGAGWKISAILLTHQHFDHINAVPDLLAKIDVPVYVHKKDAPEVQRQIPELKRMDHGDSCKLGTLDISFIHTPGHTPGSQCFLVEGNLLTGDTLFINSIGRTDLPGGSAKELFQSLQKIKALPDETVIYPGHNYGATPHDHLGGQKKTNPYVMIGKESEFLQMF